MAYVLISPILRMVCAFRKILNCLRVSWSSTHCFLWEEESWEANPKSVIWASHIADNIEHLVQFCSLYGVPTKGFSRILSNVHYMGISYNWFCADMGHKTLPNQLTICHAVTWPTNQLTFRHAEWYAKLSHQAIIWSTGSRCPILVSQIMLM